MGLVDIFISQEVKKTDNQYFELMLICSKNVNLRT